MPYGRPREEHDPRFPLPPVPTLNLLASNVPRVLTVLAGRYEDPFLYGSLARGEAVAGSDIDIAATAVESLDPYWDRRLSLELSWLLGHPVDLIRWDRMSPEHRATAERDALPLHCLG
ncbi:MAG: nucleotidyltransferase domain-containing protein [Coriobacteriia bacterium]